MVAILSRFLRSPLGLGLWLSCALFSAALTLFGGMPFLGSALVFAALGCILSLLLLVTPLGARSVVAERERDRLDRDAQVLGVVAAARKRLALLRLENETVKAELDRLVLAAGKYLEAAVKNDNRDPETENAVLGAVEVVNDYLLLLDAASSSRKRGVEAEAGVEVADRTARALAASSDEIERRLGVVPAAADRAAAREELR